MHIKFNGIQNPIFHFDQLGNQPVTCMSTFPHRPMQIPTYHEVWLDANILSQIPAVQPNPNIASLVNAALVNGFGMNPILALAEYNRGHDPMTAMDIMLNRVPRMEQVYGFEFDMLAVTRQSTQLTLHVDNDRKYVKSLSDFMIVIKYFFAKKNWSFKRRFETFAKFIKGHLPFLESYYMWHVYISLQKSGETFSNLALQRYKKQCMCMKILSGIENKLTT